MTKRDNSGRFTAQRTADPIADRSARCEAAYAAYDKANQEAHEQYRKTCEAAWTVREEQVNEAVRMYLSRIEDIRGVPVSEPEPEDSPEDEPEPGGQEMDCKDEAADE